MGDLAGNCSGIVCVKHMTEIIIFESDNGSETTKWGDTGNDTRNNTADVPFLEIPLVLSMESQIGLIVLYSTTTLLSIVGNVLVVLVFMRGRRCRTDIRPYLVNLAMADLVMSLFCMPFTFTSVMLKTWVFSKPMCPVVLFMQHLSVSSSVFTNMAIGIDRFLVVMFPLRSRLTTSRAKYVIMSIWISAVGLSSVQLVVGRATDQYMDGYHVVTCDEIWTNQQSRRIFTTFVLFITYIIPLCILSVTYSIVSILLWKRTAPGNADQARDMQQLKAKRKVVKMLVIVVVMFGLCWLPLHTFFLVIDFNPELVMYQTEAQERLFTGIYCFAHWLAMSNSFSNPIVYGFTNDSFRAELATQCYMCFPCCSCLKKMIIRKQSFSTYETGIPRRQSTMRKVSNKQTIKQSVQNGNNVYFELKRSNSKDNSVTYKNKTADFDGRCR
ncbi:prolactin-releasing peptide receptor-like [Gigantopelta aegis]|uniref:prolactin-releasing peptide receptor-like n=1 Tax=Gigantopelta aegis TaxID=1735272 RepID=UPI001B88DBEA|nr:prolactin-releasing peptide receptor-like [Gigantopelta aegis]